MPQVWTEVIRTIGVTVPQKPLYIKLTDQERKQVFIEQEKFKFHKSDLDLSYNNFNHSKMFYKAEIDQDMSSMNLKVYAIYFQNMPRWEGVDSATSQFEVPPKLYRAFVEFVLKYFQ